MKRFQYVTAGGLAALLLSGCTMIEKKNRSVESNKTQSVSSDSESNPSLLSSVDDQQKVANPPAKTIRFEGKETLLGTSDLAPIATDQFCDELSMLLNLEKFFSAKNLICKNSDAAEQAMWERFSNADHDPLVAFVAKVLSHNLSETISWDGLLVSAELRPSEAVLYQQARSRFAIKLKSEEPTDQETEELRIAAERLSHPLAMADALRLIALRELAAHRNAWAESLFLQASEIAEQHHDLARAAECWLMVATTINRTDRQLEAQLAWTRSVENQLAFQVASNRPMNVNYWLRIEEQRPSGAAWPKQTSASLKPCCIDTGIQVSNESAAELVVFCSIASSLYESSHPEQGLVNFKKAEAFAKGDNLIWLQIAQSKCLAALGQSEAAAALLGGPASSKNPSIASAASAAIGIAKLQAGAYEQGAQMLNKALSGEGSTDWPTRDVYEADFALAQLIIGDTDRGLESLHAVQEKFRIRSDRVSLLQSLENELQLLEHEGRSEKSTIVASQIREIETSLGFSKEWQVTR